MPRAVQENLHTCSSSRPYATPHYVDIFRQVNSNASTFEACRELYDGGILQRNLEPQRLCLESVASERRMLRDLATTIIYETPCKGSARMDPATIEDILALWTPPHHIGMLVVLQMIVLACHDLRLGHID